MSQLGELLRQRREKQGMTLEALQARTKIRIKYLEAIEAGEFAVIPGEVYLRGFIRNIATELSLDQQEVMQVYYQETKPASESVAAAPDATPPKPAKEPMAEVREPEVAKPLGGSQPRAVAVSRVQKKTAKKAPRLLWLLVALAIVIAGVLYWDSIREQPLVEDPSILPPDGSSDPDPQPDPAPPQPQVELQNPGDDNPIYLVHPGPLEVVLTAEGADCWVGAKADTNSQQMTLRPNGTASLTLNATNEIVVRVGNPAALRVTINGIDQGIVGGTRVIDLTVRLQSTP